MLREESRGRDVCWNMFEDPAQAGDTHFTVTLRSRRGYTLTNFVPSRGTVGNEISVCLALWASV